MPRVHLTLEERENAEQRSFNARQDNDLRLALLKAKKEKRMTYDTLAQKADIGRTTAFRILDLCESLDSVELESLRKVCGALGVRLRLCAE